MFGYNDRRRDSDERRRSPRRRNSSRSRSPSIPQKSVSRRSSSRDVDRRRPRRWRSDSDSDDDSDDRDQRPQKKQRQGFFFFSSWWSCVKLPTLGSPTRRWCGASRDVLGLTASMVDMVTRFRMAQVCRGWKQALSNNSTSWHTSLDIRTKPSALSNLLIRARYPQDKDSWIGTSLVWEGPYDQMEAAWLHLGKMLSSIRLLELTIDTDCLLVLGCLGLLDTTRLVKLKVIATRHIVEPLLAAFQNRPIQHVVLRCDLGYGNQIPEMVHKMPLRSLELYPIGVRPADFLFCAEKWAPNAERLVLHRILVVELGNLPNLVSLGLVSCTLHRDEKFQGLPLLRHLTLMDHPYIERDMQERRENLGRLVSLSASCNDGGPSDAIEIPPLLKHLEWGMDGRGFEVINLNGALYSDTHPDSGGLERFRFGSSLSHDRAMEMMALYHGVGASRWVTGPKNRPVFEWAITRAVLESPWPFGGEPESTTPAKAASTLKPRSTAMNLGALQRLSQVLSNMRPQDTEPEVMCDSSLGYDPSEN